MGVVLDTEEGIVPGTKRSATRSLTKAALFPVLASLLGASLLWIVVHLVCLWAGVSGRAPSFTAILLGASIVYPARTNSAFTLHP